MPVNIAWHRLANSDIARILDYVPGELTSIFLHKHYSITVAQPRVYTLVRLRTQGMLHPVRAAHATHTTWI